MRNTDDICAQSKTMRPYYDAIEQDNASEACACYGSYVYIDGHVNRLYGNHCVVKSCTFNYGKSNAFLLVEKNKSTPRIEPLPQTRLVWHRSVIMRIRKWIGIV